MFDLVRVHKFGHLDERVKEFTPDAKKPSHMAMEHWAIRQPQVKRLAMSERQADYAEMADAFDEDVEEPDTCDENWEDQLELHHKTSLPLPTAGNIELILSNGVWKGILAFDAFGNSEVTRRPLPWREQERPGRSYEPWLGADDKRLQHWFSKAHSINGGKTIQNAFTEVVHKNSFHPIKSYLESAVWDGVPRAESLFTVYLGAADTHYVRQVTRKMLLAAVARLYRPGCKFDQMLVLVGPQGAGKSSLLAKLGREWFSDSLRTFENKEAGEHLQSGWIFEIGELSAMKKTEVEEVKRSCPRQRTGTGWPMIGRCRSFRANVYFFWNHEHPGISSGHDREPPLLARRGSSRASRAEPLGPFNRGRGLPDLGGGFELVQGGGNLGAGSRGPLRG